MAEGQKLRTISKEVLKERLESLDAVFSRPFIKQFYKEQKESADKNRRNLASREQKVSFTDATEEKVIQTQGTETNDESIFLSKAL